jgi:hypothetical protein
MSAGDLAEARRALAEEDLHGAFAWIELDLRGLRAISTEEATAALGVYAVVLDGWYGQTLGALAEKTAHAVDDPDALYRLGHALVGAGEFEPALGVLGRALDRAVGVEACGQIVHEACAAEELLGRYARAARWIDGASSAVRHLPMSRYLHAFARLIERDPEPARAEAFARHAGPNAIDSFLVRRLQTMLARHDALAELGREGADEAQVERVWHAIVTGEVLLNPRDTPRETLASMGRRLDALRAAVGALGLEPRRVTAPEDRDGEILGQAIASRWGLPFVARGVGVGAGTLVAVWDLGALAEASRAGLRESVPGEILYVHAGRVDQEQALSAELVGVGSTGALGARGPLRPPWGHDAEVFALAGQPAPTRDARPLAEIARAVAETAPDGPQAPEGDSGLVALVERMAALPEAVGFAGLAREPTRRGRRWRRRSSEDREGP